MFLNTFPKNILSFSQSFELFCACTFIASKWNLLFELNDVELGDVGDVELNDVGDVQLNDVGDVQLNDVGDVESGDVVDVQLEDGSVQSGDGGGQLGMIKEAWAFVGKVINKKLFCSNRD